MIDSSSLKFSGNFYLEYNSRIPKNKCYKMFFDS